MLKRFYAIAALSTASAAMLLPTLLSTPVSAEVLARNNHEIIRGKESSIQNFKLAQKQNKEDDVEVSERTISSEELKLLRKDPKSFLLEQGFEVPDGTQIEVSESEKLRGIKKIIIKWFRNGRRKKVVVKF